MNLRRKSNRNITMIEAIFFEFRPERDNNVKGQLLTFDKREKRWKPL